MIISELQIHQLRNITHAHVHLHSDFNIIVGENGSGKSSFLEALYILGCGHSFRTRDISSIIQHNTSSLTVFGRSVEEDTVSVQKSLNKPTLVKVNHQFCSSSSQLAYRLPIQVFYQDIFQIIDAGPVVRRSLLDWGLFHVKQDYLSKLNRYKQLLKQRNALLKQPNAKSMDFNIWNEQLSVQAELIDKERSQFFQQWIKIFYKVLQQLSDVNCKLQYYKGWDRKNEGISLKEVLDKMLESDQHRCFTQKGAHQADLLIEVNEHKAKQILSRGQQKIILIALKLSQAMLLSKPCMYLFDDILAELDQTHVERLFEFIKTIPGQKIVTSIYNNPFDSFFSKKQFFKIHSGKIEAL